MIYSTIYSKVIKYKLEQLATPKGLPAPSPVTPHDDIINKEANRWKSFVSTAHTTSPGQLISDEEFTANSDKLGHPQEFADMAAVLAGSKPAAWVDRELVEDHPVGRSMAARLLADGHVFSPLHEDMYFIGQPDAVWAAHNAAWSKPRKDHYGIGVALGYPEEAVRKFVGRIQSHNS